MLRILGAIGILAAVLAATARADIKPEDWKGKKGKEDEKAPREQGMGEGMEKKMKNPLPEIVDLMRKVEERLADAETDRWTQEEQEKIAKALEGQEEAIERLKKLIEEAEAQAQGGSGGSERQEEKGGKSEEERERRLRERKEDGRRQPVDPQQQPGERQREREQEEREREQERREAKPPAEQPRGGGAERPANPGAKWGDLPPKEAREMLDSKRKAMPPRWRRQLEEYYKKLEETQK